MDQERMQLVGDNLELYAMPPQEREKRKRELNLLETLERLRITTETQLPPQQFLFRMLDKPCFPRGELVTVTGKAKSGKTFFLSLLMGMGCLQHAASRKSPALGIERIPDAPLKVLWFDTELNNKSFEIYSCELLKPQIIFSVEQCNSRRYRWDGNYYFLVDEQGMPHQADVPATTAGATDGKPQKESYPPMNANYASWHHERRKQRCPTLLSSPSSIAPLIGGLRGGLRAATCGHGGVRGRMEEAKQSTSNANKK